MRTFSRAHLVEFVNVADRGFEAEAWFAGRRVAPKALDDLFAEMHVFDEASGQLHTRVAAFRCLYAALGYPRLLGWTRHQPFDALADAAYQFIADNKHRLAWLAK